MISLLLADDHPVILRGLRDLIGAHDDLRVIGEETDAQRVIEAVTRLKPDVLVMDLMMPGISGMDLIREIAQHHPDTRIVVLSMHSNVAYVWEALRNGALGYVLKCAKNEDLIRTLHEASARRRYLSPPLSENDLEEYSRKVRQYGLDPHDMLTDRERQVLRLAAEGNTSSQIAVQLDIGVRTVESHRANLLHKLGLHNQTELVRYAIQRGIIPPG